ncbi:hypothetical protein OROGR_019518 [Orobanche gracilis]
MKKRFDTRVVSSNTPPLIELSCESKDADCMQAIGEPVHEAVALSSFFFQIGLSYYGAENHRLASTLATKGVGHLVRKGTGGRSSVSGIIATVFGATGFLGRYLVQQLAKMGSQVLVPFRGSEDSPRHLKLMGDLGQIVPMSYNPRDENSIKAVMAKANVVINLIGREYETRNYSFEEVNHHMAEQLAVKAQIAKEHGGIMRYIQVSCLGASPSSPSRMLRTKAAAEEAVLHELPEDVSGYEARVTLQDTVPVSGTPRGWVRHGDGLKSSPKRFSSDGFGQKIGDLVDLISGSNPGR